MFKKILTNYLDYRMILQKHISMVEYRRIKIIYGDKIWKQKK